MIKAILLSSLVFNLGVLVGRVSGFVRESFVASTYGVSVEADQIILMLTLPDLLVNLLLGGALSAVLIPELTQKTEQAKKILYQALILLSLFFIGVAVALSWQSVFFVNLLAPGFSDEVVNETAGLFSWVVWLIPLTVLAGATTAYLHSINAFAVASLGTLIVNLSIIIGLLLVYYGYGTLYVVAISVLLGGVLRLLSQVSIIEVNWNPITAMKPFLIGKPLCIRYFQAVLSGGLLFLLPFVARAYASELEAGSIALLNYGLKLVEFPLLITVTFLSVVLFPRLSQSFKLDDALHQKLIRHGLQITFLLASSTALVLFIVAQDYASMVFGYGKMQDGGISKVVSITQVGLIMLPLQGVALYLTAILHARKNTKTPMFINAMGLGVFILLMQFDIFTSSLDSITLAIVASYATVLVLFFLVMKSNQKRIVFIFFEKRFLLSVIFLLCGLFICMEFIEGVRLSPFSKLLFSFIVGLFFVFLTLIANGHFSSFKKFRI